MNASNDFTLKDLFAVALLRTPDDPFKAACAVFGLDTGRALRASAEWVNDMYVLAKQAELLELHGEDFFMPTKLTLARRVFELAESANIDKKDKIKAYELYGNIMGFIAKQTAIANVTNNNTVVSNRVMVVKDHGTDEDWERKTVEHQSKLLEHARD